MEKDSIITGLALGAVIPVLGYMAIDGIFDMLENSGAIDVASGGAISRRLRTVGLLAICSNILPLQWAKRKYYDETIRGLVFPTLVYVGFWLYQYQHLLF